MDKRALSAGSWAVFRPGSLWLRRSRPAAIPWGSRSIPSPRSRSIRRWSCGAWTRGRTASRPSRERPGYVISVLGTAHEEVSSRLAAPGLAQPGGHRAAGDRAGPAGAWPMRWRCSNAPPTPSTTPATTPFWSAGSALRPAGGRCPARLLQGPLRRPVRRPRPVESRPAGASPLCRGDVTATAGECEFPARPVIEASHNSHPSVIAALASMPAQGGPRGRCPAL